MNTRKNISKSDVVAYLVKHGFNEKDAKIMVEKNYDVASRVEGATLRTIADFISHVYNGFGGDTGVETRRIAADAERKQERAREVNNWIQDKASELLDKGASSLEALRQAQRLAHVHFGGSYHKYIAGITNMSNRKLKIENAPDPSTLEERAAARKAFWEKWQKAYGGRPATEEGTTARKERIQETDNARTYTELDEEKMPLAKRTPRQDIRKKFSVEAWDYNTRNEAIDALIAARSARKKRLQETDNARTYKDDTEGFPLAARQRGKRWSKDWALRRFDDAVKSDDASFKESKRATSRDRLQETENRFCENSECENAKLSADEREFRKAAKKYAKDKAEKNLFSLFPAPTREALRQEKEREESLYGFMTGRPGGATPPWRKKNA